MKRVFLLIILMQILSSCANLVSMQDGRTLKKRTFEVTPSVSVAKFRETLPNDKGADDEYDYMPFYAVRIRYGIKENFDLGAYFDISTNIGFNGKYQVIGNKASKFNTSIGMDFGANFNLFLYERLQYFYSFPIYISYNPNDRFAVFLTPRFINNSCYIYDNKYSDIKKIGYEFQYNRFALSYGIILYGKKHKIGFEISNNSSDVVLKPTHFSLGYIIRF